MPLWDFVFVRPALIYLGDEEPTEDGAVFFC